MTDSTRWAAALTRAQELTTTAGLTFDQNSWDDQAIARILAITLYAQALSTSDAGPTPVGLGQTLWTLSDVDRWETSVSSVLEIAGHLPGHDPRNAGDAGDPVAGTWEWLHRTWDPDAPAGQRWDGMTRGIARGLPDPAINVCIGWAWGAVDRALLAERGGWPRHTHVKGVGAAIDGLIGRIDAGAWGFDDQLETVEPGPVAAYAVTFPALIPATYSAVYPAEQLTLADPADVPPPAVVYAVGALGPFPDGGQDH